MIFTFDFSSQTPIYMQLRNQIVVAIADKRLLPGDKLPTVRSLADESGINSMTVSKAYQLLKQEGYIVTDRRSGATVSDNVSEISYSKKDLEDLMLKVFELKLAGMKKDELIDLILKFYDEEVK